MILALDSAILPLQLKMYIIITSLFFTLLLFNFQHTTIFISIRKPENININ